MLAIEVLCTVYVQAYEVDPGAASRGKYRSGAGCFQSSLSYQLFSLLHRILQYAVDTSNSSFIITVYLSCLRISSLLPYDALPHEFHLSIDRLRTVFRKLKDITFKDKEENQISDLDGLQSILIGKNYNLKFDWMSRCIEQDSNRYMLVCNSLLLGVSITVEIIQPIGEKPLSISLAHNDVRTIPTYYRWYFAAIQLCRMTALRIDYEAAVAAMTLVNRFSAEIKWMKSPMEYFLSIQTSTALSGKIL